MGTIIDYLDWYGDLSFDSMPFNEVDALVLAQLSYLDMEGIGADSEKGVRVDEASQCYFASHTPEEIYATESLGTPLTPFVLQGMAAGRRFSGCRLARYEAHRDTELHRQFAAVCVKLPDEITFVAYRGTDDTLVGWREDFEMGCGTVPAQADALDYLTRAAEAFSGHLLYVGGHSKGGNLAVYASACCEPAVQGRIVKIFDFDGPGFIASALPEKRLALVRKRIMRVVPGYCVIGALFQRGKPNLVVKSEGSGIMQHSALNWQVKGPGFVKLAQREKGALRFIRVFNSWMDSIPLEQRSTHVNEAFNALESTGVTTMSEIARLDPISLRRLIVAVDALAPDTRQVVNELVLALLGSTLEDLSSPFPAFVETAEDVRDVAGAPPVQEAPTIEGMLQWRERMKAQRGRENVLVLLGSVVGERAVRAVFLLVGGIVLMGNAGTTKPVVPLVLVSVVGLYAVYTLVRFWNAHRRTGSADPLDGALGVGLAVLTALLLCFPTVITAVFNLVLGGLMLCYGLFLLRRSVRRWSGRDARWWHLLPPGVAAVCLGVGTLVGPSHIVPQLAFGCGAFLVLKALTDALRIWRDRAPQPSQLP